MLQKLKYLFTPNAKVPSSSFFKILVVELLLTIFLWNYNKSAHFPGPIEVIEAIPSLFQGGNFLNQLFTSFFLSMSAILFSVVVSLFISYLSRLPVGGPISVIVTKFRFATYSGLVFIFCMMFPSGTLFKVFSLSFATIPWIVTACLSEFDKTENSKFIQLRTLGMSEWAILREVIVLGKLDKVLEIIRQNYAMIWMMIATVEAVYISEGGVGALLEMMRKYLSNLPSMMAIQLIVLCLSACMDNIFQLLNKIIAPWASLSNEKK